MNKRARLEAVAISALKRGLVPVITPSGVLLFTPRGRYLGMRRVRARKERKW